jgi:two-component system response regulator HydG
MLPSGRHFPDGFPMTRGLPAILVVDDGPDICQNMSDILNDQGYRVDTAREAKLAIRLLEGQRYDVALLDFRMPAIDGLAVSREVTRRNPKTVVLLITGYSEDVLPAQAFAAGVHRILTKPLDVAELLGEIEKLLAG